MISFAPVVFPGEQGVAARRADSVAGVRSGKHHALAIVIGIEVVRIGRVTGWGGECAAAPRVR